MMRRRLVKGSLLLVRVEVVVVGQRLPKTEIEAEVDYSV